MTDPNRPNDLLSEARDEIVGMGKQGMAHPSTKPVLTGAAVGAVAAAVLPVITWPVPADISYGTALGAAQLNAVAKDGAATVAGTYAYTPVAGTVLAAGSGRPSDGRPRWPSGSGAIAGDRWCSPWSAVSPAKITR